MEQGRLVKVGLLPCDAAASQNKAAEKLSQSMSVGLLPTDTATSQDELRDGAESSAASAFFSSACYLTVVSWLTYPFVLSGMKHLRTHESVGQLPVDAEDWTSKGAVMLVKNPEQFNS